MIRVLKWTAVHAAMAVLGWFAIIESTEWAANVLMFLLILNALLWLGIATTKDVREKVRGRGRSVPTAVANLYDLAFICLLAGGGWFFFASVYVVQWIAECCVYEGGTRNEGRFDA